MTDVDTEKALYLQHVFCSWMARNVSICNMISARLTRLTYWIRRTWLYPAEIVPLRIRAPANALSTSANWAFNFMVVMITPVAFQNIGYQTYIIFAVMYVHMH
jgi:hypothetical protein